MSFFSLPLELREMIYYLVLPAEKPFEICSLPKARKPPKGKAKVKADEQESSKDHCGTGAILRTCKQIHDEAKHFFFATNSFTVGVGPHGSTTTANLHGLKSFRARVPARYISLIQHVVLAVSYREPINRWPVLYLGARPPPADQKFFSSSEAMDLQSISLILVKHFTGLKSISLCLTRVLFFPTPPLRLKPSASQAVLVNAMRILVTHPSARSLSIQQMSESVEMTSATAASLHSHCVIAKFLGDCAKEGNNEVACNVDGVPFDALDLRTYLGRQELERALYQLQW